jgi:muramoyltetrapeptide carboxypeptidase LdcA involved in peptidoglycan recycling
VFSFGLGSGWTHKGSRTTGAVGWSEAERAQLHTCVLEACGDYGYPVIAGIECSHAAPLLALPIGVLARLVDDQLIVEEAAVA